MAGTDCDDTDPDVSPGALSDPNDDGIDQDCNGVDGVTETACANLEDDDGDGLVDCDDPDCSDSDYCLPESSGSDQIDNDLDGSVDCFDEDCDSSEDCDLPEFPCDDQLTMTVMGYWIARIQTVAWMWLVVDPQMRPTV